jgi:hypothetical protein
MLIYWAAMTCGIEGTYTPTFRRNILPPSSAVNMETESLRDVAIYPWRYNPEDKQRHFHCNDNLKSGKSYCCSKLKGMGKEYGERGKKIKVPER